MPGKNALPSKCNSAHEPVRQMSEPKPRLLHSEAERCCVNSKRGCYASVTWSVEFHSNPLSGRCQVCRRRPRRRGWAIACLFALRRSTRRPPYQAPGRSEPVGGFKRACRDGGRKLEQGRSGSVAVQENYWSSRNHSPTAALILQHRAKPPAPHPQSPGVEPRPR
jgi:hypothetical protein